MLRNNSHLGFRHGIISLALIVVLIVLTQTSRFLGQNLSSMILGLLVIGIGFTSILGLSKSLNGLKEPNTGKKIVGLLLNFGLALLFIGVIAANVLDMMQVFD